MKKISVLEFILIFSLSSLFNLCAADRVKSFKNTFERIRNLELKLKRPQPPIDDPNEIKKIENATSILVSNDEELKKEILNLQKESNDFDEVVKKTEDKNLRALRNLEGEEDRLAGIIKEMEEENRGFLERDKSAKELLLGILKEKEKEEEGLRLELEEQNKVLESRRAARSKSKKESELNDLEGKLSRTKLEVSQLKEDFDKKKKEHEATKEKLEEERKTISENKKVEQISFLNDERSRLEQEAEEDLNNYERRLRESYLKNLGESTKKAKLDNESGLEQLRKRLEELGQEGISLINEGDSLDKKINEAESIISKKEQMITELNKGLMDRRNNIVKLKNSVKGLKEEIDRESKNTQDKLSRIDSFKEQLWTKGTSKGVIQQDVNRLEEELRRKSTSLEDLINLFERVLGAIRKFHDEVYLPQLPGAGIDSRIVKNAYEKEVGDEKNKKNLQWLYERRSEIEKFLNELETNATKRRNPDRLG